MRPEYILLPVLYLKYLKSIVKVTQQIGLNSIRRFLFIYFFPDKTKLPVPSFKRTILTIIPK